MSIRAIAGIVMAGMAWTNQSQLSVVGEAAKRLLETIEAGQAVTNKRALALATYELLGG